jgi:hypothetical protein
LLPCPPKILLSPLISSLPPPKLVVAAVDPTTTSAEVVAVAIDLFAADLVAAFTKTVVITADLAIASAEVAAATQRCCCCYPTLLLLLPNVVAAAPSLLLPHKSVLLPKPVTIVTQVFAVAAANLPKTHAAGSAEALPDLATNRHC